MNLVEVGRGSEMAGAMPARAGGLRHWQHWMPYAAVAWSWLYAALGAYWAVSGRGFPYTPEAASDPLGPLVGRLGPGAGWILVILAGLPAALMGMAMLRGVRRGALRRLLILAGTLLAGALLLLMIGLTLLQNLGYVPFGVYSLLTGTPFGPVFLAKLTQWAAIHQVLCLFGGFLWLAATLVYARKSAGTCVTCGRGDGAEGWTSPDHAARWGRIALVVSLVPPVFYALTRYAWALGVPLGMSEAAWRDGQERGIWVAGLFLANFGLVGAALTLGLVQRWGEVFPRWMIGLAGRRVPIALAVVPASLASVLLVVGGIVIGSATGVMVGALATTEVEGLELIWETAIQLGPALLFPVWGAALAVATLGYYYRRRGRCSVCGRGASELNENPLTV